MIHIKPLKEISENAEVIESDLLYSEYMKYNLNINREDMPQIYGKFSLADVMYYISSRFTVFKRRVSLGDLKPTQNILYDDKINSMVQNWNKDKEQDIVFITGINNYLIDSHHTWAAILELYGKDYENEIFYVNVDVLELIEFVNSLDTTQSEK